MQYQVPVMEFSNRISLS